MAEDAQGIGPLNVSGAPLLCSGHPGKIATSRHDFFPGSVAQRVR